MLGLEEQKLKEGKDLIRYFCGSCKPTKSNGGRARGMFQFYGANWSGRWAGRIIQLQNLPQNHMDDLEQARGLMRNGDYEALSLLYDFVPAVLSAL